MSRPRKRKSREGADDTGRGPEDTAAGEGPLDAPEGTEPSPTAHDEELVRAVSEAADALVAAVLEAEGAGALEVTEARNGDQVLPGRALIAPGNHHMRLARQGAKYVVTLDQTPPVNHHRPSVDVLFETVATAAGQNAVGVILTGMGDDGARGLLRMRGAGAYTIGQDKDSCVVYGMPREAFALGGVCEVQPLDAIAGSVLARL